MVRRGNGGYGCAVLRWALFSWVLIIYFYGRRRSHHVPINNHYLYTLLSLTHTIPHHHHHHNIMHIYLMSGSSFTVCLFSHPLKNHVVFTLPVMPYVVHRMYVMWGSGP